MTSLKRFGVAVESELLDRFDRAIAGKGYATRSEALRDLMRERLVEEEWRSDEETVGVVTLVYDHGVRELTERLTELQHHFTGQVISTLHVHLDVRHCLEVILVRGTGRVLGAFADRLAGLKGVVYGKLVPATLGQSLWPRGHRDHSHPHGHEHAPPAHEHAPPARRARRAARRRGARA
jgi:CopG family nickel-responsive transcriptional regulator